MRALAVPVVQEERAAKLGILERKWPKEEQGEGRYAAANEPRENAWTGHNTPSEKEVELIQI